MTMTAWQLHVEKWKGGCGSDQCGGRKKVCLARGSLPCDVFFCGEAPGPSENVLGQPFVGPAGQLLDRIVRESTAQLPKGMVLKFGFGNLVGCIPFMEGSTTKFDKPPDDQVQACAPRLQELLTLASPALLVMVGKEADDWLVQGYRHSIKHNVHWTHTMVHPAAILRAKDHVKGMMIHKAVLELAEKLDEVFVTDVGVVDPEIPF